MVNLIYQILEKEQFEIGESHTQIMQIVYSGYDHTSSNTDNYLGYDYET
jgi:hypothetical protein